MKKKREMYGISFIKLVDSAWAPQLDFKKFDNFKLFMGSKYNISVKTSVIENDFGTHYEPINIRKFSSKEKFIAFAVQEAVNVWNEYEASKQFYEEATEIVEIIKSGEAPSDIGLGVEAPLDDEYIHDDKREYCKFALQSDELTEEDIVAKAKEIKERSVGDGWKPYMVLKEIVGVDLINLPDIATGEAVAEMQSKRPNAVDNKGVIRRCGAKVKKAGDME